MDFNCHHFPWYLEGTADPHEKEVFNFVISSDLLPLNEPDTPTLFTASLLKCFLISLSCGFLFLDVLQDLCSGHFPALFIMSLSLLFRTNKRTPAFNFQKARWNDFSVYINSHCLFAEKYHSLSTASWLFTYLIPNAIQSSIPFYRVRSQS